MEYADTRKFPGGLLVMDSLSGHLDKTVGPVASRRSCWRHNADEIHDFKCYPDNLISLGMQSPTEAFFDEFCLVHPDKTLFEPREDIECMNFIREALTKTQRKTIFPCLADFWEIANHFKLISDCLTKVQRQSIFPCLADFQEIENHFKLSSDILTEIQSQSILPCLADFQEIANHFKLISDILTEIQSQSIFPCLADFQEIANHFKLICDILTDIPSQSIFPCLADFQEIANHFKLISDTLTDIQSQSIFPCLADFQEIANHFKLISGVYRNDQVHGKVTFQMEDCAFNGKGNRWLKEVKFRTQKSHLAPRNNPKNPWMDLHKLYPNAEVEIKRNFVKVTIDSPQENHEFAVFGIPDVNDRKRMQVGLFGEKPLQGEDWKIWVILFDDTMMAFQHVCKMEEARGRELLSTLAGLFVFNSGEDIKINVRDVELGWKIKDGNEKVIKSNDAWNSPENSTDFPCCHFEVSHVDQGKKTFTCGVTVSHKQDSAEAEVTAVFEEPKKDREELHLPFEGDIAADDFSDVLVFLQMFAMAMWFINSAVQPAGVLLDPN